MQNSNKGAKKKKKLMNVLYEMQPWVVQATRPNIYNQERTIMNNTRHGRTEVPWTIFVSASRTFSEVEWFIYTVWYSARSLCVHCCC